jgi:hypothetical protein
MATVYAAYDSDLTEAWRRQSWIHNLEQRIVDALQPDAAVTSADVAALIDEAEAGIVKAEKEATVDRTLSLDPKAARQAIADAAFGADRLRTLLSKLQARYQQACEEERVEEYEAEAQVLDEESIQLAQELHGTYPPAENKLSNLFTRIAAHRQRISALHQRRPAGVESVRDPELIARNLDRFDRERPSLLAEVHLLDWKQQPPNLAAASAVNGSGFCRNLLASLWPRRLSEQLWAARCGAAAGPTVYGWLLCTHDSWARGTWK